MNSITNKTIETNQVTKTNMNINNNNNNFKLFLGGVPSRMEYSDLMQFFQKTVPSFLKLELPMQNSKSGPNRNKGFAVITLKTKKAQQSLLKGKFMQMNGRKMTLRPFCNGKKLKNAKINKENSTIYLGNLPRSFKLEEVKATLEQEFGEVEDLFRLINPLTKKEKACAFCFFKSEKSANKAIKAESFKFKTHAVQIARFDKSQKTSFKKLLMKKKACISSQSELKSNPELPDMDHNVKPSQNKYFKQRTEAWVQWKAHVPENQNLRINRSSCVLNQLKRRTPSFGFYGILF